MLWDNSSGIIIWSGVGGLSGGGLNVVDIDEGMKIVSYSSNKYWLVMHNII